MDLPAFCSPFPFVCPGLEPGLWQVVEVCYSPRHLYTAWCLRLSNIQCVVQTGGSDDRPRTGALWEMEEEWTQTLTTEKCLIHLLKKHPEKLQGGGRGKSVRVCVCVRMCLSQVKYLKRWTCVGETSRKTMLITLSLSTLNMWLCHNIPLQAAMRGFRGSPHILVIMS